MSSDANHQPLDRRGSHRTTIYVDRDQRALRLAATFFAATVVVHNADHLRRGANLLHSDVFAVGMAAIVLEVTLVVLVFQGHPIAPFAAVVGGTLLALGYVEVHFLPAHALLSDSLVNTPGIALLSPLAASLEVVGALALEAAGFAALTRHDDKSSRRPAHALMEAVMQPVPLVLVVTQTATFIVSALQFLHG